MKTKKALYILILLLIWIIIKPLHVFAENTEVSADDVKASDELKSFSDNRNIYVGDIITLKITAQGLSDEELREKFHDFEITMLEKINDEYLLSLRTFEPGEYKVLVGDKEIIINVSSTLNDINREDIFEGGTGINEAYKAFYWRIYFYIAGGIFLLSGGFVLLKLIVKRKNKEPSPYQIFLKRTSVLIVEDDNFLVDLTLCFKEYLEGMLGCQIIGKTSSEIINELKGLKAEIDNNFHNISSKKPTDISISEENSTINYQMMFKGIETMLPTIEAWLIDCDRLKFMSEFIPIEGKHRLYNELIELVEKIEANYSTNPK